MPRKKLIFLLIFLLSGLLGGSHFPIEEATIRDIHRAFTQNKLTSRELLDFYLDRIRTLNPELRSVLEINPDAQRQAEQADRERRLRRSSHGRRGMLGELHGIPVLLKDSIATEDRLNTTAGSYALLGSKVARDAHVVKRLRRAGAVILGKASMNEFYSRSFRTPNGWCARAGQAKNPYLKSGDTCGSSSGSAISVAANMVAVSLGTETSGSIICPADHLSIVGIKPTVGLTSRAGVVQVSLRQDSVGPICRTVSDAVYVLDAIVGFDPRDYIATKEAAKYIPVGGYKQFLNKYGLQGKRLGIVRNPFTNFLNESTSISAFNLHVDILRQKGAIVVDNLEIKDVDIILDVQRNGEAVALLAEFKIAINSYLRELVQSPVRSLADLINFNLKHPHLEMIEEYGQDIFIAAEMTSGIGEAEMKAIEMMKTLSRDGFEKLMKENELDAMVTLGYKGASVLAIGGYPAISVPAGYDTVGMPFGICFGGLKGTEPKLIEIAYGFEQATLVRRPPFSNSKSLELSEK